ncbi:hypothetical protein KIH74_22745 [Kineosporia sp. J2-2]|uniref:FtsK domain-containing protein n=1 Tax=Kineosporia corallincola TaxID=2835133 RepID=A0ABS5TKZ9_9ACTN|nr:FtsK/SpoIIIE domain-containing protein [Kineosporia corallincola]MBT0771777.1 hypothetical protein [Kineosporia corallincola]
MSSNHQRIGSAWRRSHDQRRREVYGDSPICHYLGRLPGACDGDVERHHVVELVDGGHRDSTVDACHRHHVEVTRMNKELRTGIPPLDDFVDGVVDTVKELLPKRSGQKTKPAGQAGGRRGGQAAGQKNASRPAVGWTVVDIHLVATVAVLAGAVALRWVDMSGWAWTLAGAWAGYLLVAGWWLLTVRRRAVERAEVLSLAVRAVKADPRFVTAKRVRWGWQHGLRADIRAARVHFPDVEAMNDPGTRKRVAEMFWQALHAEVEFPDHALHPYFDWWVAEGPSEPTDEPMPAEEPAEGQHEALTGRIAEGLRTSLKVPAKDRDKVSVSVEAADKEGPLRIRVEYPDSVKDESDEFAPAVVAKVTAKGPKGMRWRAEPDTQANVMVLHRRPPMPSKIDNPMGSTNDPGRGLPWHVIPIAREETGRPAVIDLKKNPHTLFVGKTRTGKTVSARTFMLGAARNGFDVPAVDPKQIEFDGLEVVPGITVYADDEANVVAVETVHAEMKRRYRLKHEQKVRLDSHRPILLTIDEYQEFCEVALALHLEEGGRGKEAPVVGMVKSIARLGAAANIFLLLLTQRSDADWFSGVLRENMGNRGAWGRLSMEASRMVFGSSNVGRDVPSIKGRGNYLNPDGEIVEIQSYWTPNPEDDNLAVPDRELMDQLLAACQNRAPWGDVTEAAPAVPAENGPIGLGLDELALMLEDEEFVWVLDDQGEAFKVVEVGTNQDDEPEITHELGDGSREVVGVDEWIRFELRGESS